MYLSDETLEIISNYFKLAGIEKAEFIERIRSLESEIIFKSFLIYFESNKSEMELQYLERIGEGLKRDPKTYLNKLQTLFVAELGNNPELIMSVEKRLVSFLIDFLKAFSKGKDRELVQELVYSIFPNRDLYKAAVAQQTNFT